MLFKLLMTCLLGWAGISTLGCNKKAEAPRDKGKPETASEAIVSERPAVSQVITLTKEGGKCEPHNALKSDCFICDASLREKGRLWCKEHERYEDRCFLCHPEIEDPDRLWCKEHHLYEDECFLCHPELKTDSSGSKGSKAVLPKDTVANAKAIKSSDLFCDEHGVFERECGICHPELLSGLSAGEGMKVRFASKESAGKAGVETSQPISGAMESGPSFMCRVTYNQNHFAQITSLASGVVQKVWADFGTRVKKGQVMAEIASPEIAAVKSAYLRALSDLNVKETIYRRGKALVEKQVISQQEYEQAQAEYQKARDESAMARQQLANFGMSDLEITNVVKNHSGSSTLSIRAPFAGTIIERKVVAGESVTPEVPLFALADLSTMWLELSLPAGMYSGLKVGDPVIAAIDGLGDVKVPGRLIWVSSGIDGTSRMLKARALVQNPGDILKDGMFGHAKIPSVAAGRRLGLPSEAVQRIDGGDYVFVKIEDDLYEIRKIWMEEDLEGREYVSLLAGLEAHEEVVIAGSFTMKSEFLKSKLGAGCTEH